MRACATTLTARAMDRRVRIAALLTLVLVAGPAHAHGATAGVNTFTAGFLHPLTALEHVLPLVALGLLAGQRGLKAGQGLLVAFPVAFSLSAFAGTVIASAPWLEGINAATAVIAGGLVALALVLPRSALYAIAVIVGVVHGVANGGAVDSNAALVTFVAGATLAATLVFAYAFGLTDRVLSSDKSWRPIAVRAVGSWIAAFGILTLALAALPASLANLALLSP